MTPQVPRPVALRARYLFPISSPPIRDGMIVVGNGEILAVGSAPQITRQFEVVPLDLGDVVLLPGLINAHTHLEFSDLEEPLGQPGIAFTNWIRHVISYRREQPQSMVGLQDRIVQGLREIVEAGAAAVGEIASQPFIPDKSAIDKQVLLADAAREPPSWLKELSKRPHITAFYELIGISAERMQMAKESATTYCSPESHRSFWRTALSPHAPYSCHPDLLTWACEQSATNGFPVAMHLAESREELQLLLDGSGDFRQLLEEIGVWQADQFSTSRTALDFLQILATADRALVVHGNYLNSSEIEFLANHRRQMSVVYCPRTHAYFGHAQYPLHGMLDAGVRVALGTDSRASNPDLSVWQEARFVARQYQDVSSEEILNMVTLQAATALGVEKKLGSLEIGKLAHLTYLPLSSSSDRITAQDLLWHTSVPNSLALSTRALGN